MVGSPTLRACGPPDPGEYRRSAASTKPLISPACARPDCQRSDRRPSPGPRQWRLGPDRAADSPSVMHLKRFHSCGLGESHVDQLLTGVEDLVPDGSVKLGFRTHYPQIETKLTVRGADLDDIQKKLAPV